MENGDSGKDLAKGLEWVRSNQPSHSSEEWLEQLQRNRLKSGDRLQVSSEAGSSSDGKNWPDDLEKIFPPDPLLDSWERPEQGEADVVER